MEIQNLILNNLIFLIPFFSIYFIFKKLNFYGMRREWAFDVSIIYFVLSLVYLKLIYFFQNYQNFSTFGEIFLNLNLPNQKISFFLIYNFVIALFFARFTRFSVYKILDTLTLNFVVVLGIFSIRSHEIYLILFILISSYFIEKKFNSGFTTFLFVFALTNYFLLYPVESNSLIFYLILNTMNALFTYRRMRYMTQTLSNEFIAQCKEKLIKRKEKILEDLKVIDEDVDTDRDTGNAEYLDEVAEDIKVEKNYMFKKDLEKMLENVNDALKRIDDGTYGVDKKTGEPIDPARLELFPEADENVK